MKGKDSEQRKKKKKKKNKTERKQGKKIGDSRTPLLHSYPPVPRRTLRIGVMELLQHFF